MFPHDALFVHLSAQDLVRLMRTSRRVYKLIHDVCFNITRLLAETGTLVSGSTTLQFFNRITYPGSDLDIYAHRVSARGPVEFLLQNGYTYLARKWQDTDLFHQLVYSVADKEPSYLGRGIADVLDFYKGGKKVQLIIGERTPMETILSFHTNQSDAPGRQNCIWQHNDTHGARIDSGITNTLLVEYQKLLNFALYTDYTGTAPTARLWRLPTKAVPAEKITRGNAGEGGRKAARGLETIPTGREMIRHAA
ncbi:hypothetical protein FB45DRAFT_1042920 [Roridomyces roridus]|uniref:F-box domain-containing protein n=1 Tax=Roridomyces roridus TaxID=1738132 RepID=A0AAD7AYZ4_9AGAR|nr:hypothetical protein FB45DRAFT_1042920 [Roridomyces roridus]